MNKEKEIWKTIEGFENYEASSLGRVRNAKTGRVLKPGNNRDGYLQVSLRVNKKSYTKPVHRLVAAAFIPNPDNLPCVNHKDENKANNRVENLEWCTVEYNDNFGTRNQRSAENRSKPVLQLTLDGKFIKEWPSIMEIQRQLGYSPGNICWVCKGKFKQMYGYVWEYKKIS